MNTEDLFFLLIFIIVILILTIYYPISGDRSVKKLKRSIAEGDTHQKLRFYNETMLWLWIPTILIFILIPISGISLQDIGIKWIEIDTTSLTKWVAYPAIGFYFLYLFYNITSIILFKTKPKIREKAVESISDDATWILPITQKEKRTWGLLSITAGITEEIIYRGYLFYALAVLFPFLSLVHILFITTLIFGIGHLYLGKEAIRSTLLGLLFGIFYIVFDSVIPVMIVHTAQDLVIGYILEEKEVLTNASD